MSELVNNYLAFIMARPTPSFFSPCPRFTIRNFGLQNTKVPEIQGTTQQVATEKCRSAAELVRVTYLSSLSPFHNPPPPVPVPPSVSSLHAPLKHTDPPSVPHFHNNPPTYLHNPHVTSCSGSSLLRRSEAPSSRKTQRYVSRP